MTVLPSEAQLRPKRAGALAKPSGAPDWYPTNIAAAGGILYALDTQGALHAIKIAGNAHQRGHRQAGMAGHRDGGGLQPGSGQRSGVLLLRPQHAGIRRHVRHAELVLRAA